jgi:hypothetical protein
MLPDQVTEDRPMTKDFRTLRAEITNLLAERDQVDARKREIARKLHNARVALKRAVDREQGDLFASLDDTLN